MAEHGGSWKAGVFYRGVGRSATPKTGVLGEDGVPHLRPLSEGNKPYSDTEKQRIQKIDAAMVYGETGRKGLGAPVRTKGAEFKKKYVDGTWKGKNINILKILDAHDFQFVLDTNSQLGKAKVTRLNPPSKKYKHGSVTLKNKNGETQTFDLVNLSDRMS